MIMYLLALVVVVGFVPCVKPLGVVITGRDVVVVDFVVITLCTCGMDIAL